MSSITAALKYKLAGVSLPKKVEVPSVSLYGITHGQDIENLELACALFIRDWQNCFQNYMEKGIAVFQALVAEGRLTGYCTERYYGTCICGEYSELYLSSTLTSHCRVCEGLSRKSTYQYEIQRLSIETGIHYSWLEYGFASAIRRITNASRS